MLESLFYCISGGLVAGWLWRLAEIWVRKNAWRIDPEWEQDAGIWVRKTR